MAMWAISDTLTSSDIYKIGKRTIEHGMTTSLHYFVEKYLDIPLEEMSVQDLKNLYQDDCKHQCYEVSTSA